MDTSGLLFVQVMLMLGRWSQSRSAFAKATGAAGESTAGAFS